MCGISGLLNLDGTPVSHRIVESMSESLKHRGPDGKGLFCEGAFGMGHRRLSILDLSDSGKQPMKSSCGRFVITYNGEIYNFKEIKIKLQKIGRIFNGNSDTEVLIEAFAQWGLSCLNLLNGMFAFAVWDRWEKKLHLCRDRYGIKPLYYTLKNNTFLFSSEIKAFRVHPDFSSKVNKEALLEYFTFQNIFTEQTLFADVKLLPPGCTAKISRKEKTLQINKYWDYCFEEPTGKVDEAEYLEELDRLFKQAVQRQLVSDVEIGAYLSGGMDSGSITAVASSHLPYLKTFTCGFDLQSASGLELAFDEREKAEFMSYLFKTEHYEMVLKSGDMERCLPKLTLHLEDLRVGQSYPNFYAAKLAGKFVKVCLAGTGGDEIFGGYPWRYYRAVSNNNFEDYIDKYYLHWQRLICNKLIKKVFSPIFNEVSQVWTRDIFHDVFQHHMENLKRPEDYVNHCLYFEAKTFLHGLLLVEDKLSMAHGLETRIPFLDNDLVDFAMKTPVSLKLGNLAEVIRMNENEPGKKQEKYFRKTRDGKIILRKMMSRHIPESVTGAVKQGFSAPDASWFKGESIEYVRRKLLNSNALVYDFFDYNIIANLISEHMNGKNNRRLLIWSLLNFEEWLNIFI